MFVNRVPLQYEINIIIIVYGCEIIEHVGNIEIFVRMFIIKTLHRRLRNSHLYFEGRASETIWRALGPAASVQCVCGSVHSTIMYIELCVDISFDSR